MAKVICELSSFQKLMNGNYMAEIKFQPHKRGTYTDAFVVSVFVVVERRGGRVGGGGVGCK